MYKIRRKKMTINNKLILATAGLALLNTMNNNNNNNNNKSNSRNLGNNKEYFGIWGEIYTDIWNNFSDKEKAILNSNWPIKNDDYKHQYFEYIVKDIVKLKYIKNLPQILESISNDYKINYNELIDKYSKIKLNSDDMKFIKPNLEYSLNQVIKNTNNIYTADEIIDTALSVINMLIRFKKSSVLNNLFRPNEPLEPYRPYGPNEPYRPEGPQKP